MSDTTDDLEGLTERQCAEIRSIVRDELALFAQRLGAALCAPTAPAPAITMPEDLDAAVRMAGTATDLEKLIQMQDAETQGLSRPAVLDTITWRRGELKAQAPL